MNNKLIYIVDDDAEIRELLVEVLESVDYDVIPISNGIKLFEELKNTKPDLMLLDIMMSWINGIDICSSIKKDDRYKDIPVIFITAYKEENIEKSIKESLVDDYIFKPFKIEDLLNKIEKLL